MLLQWVRLYCYFLHDINIQTAIDPANKLNFYRDDPQEFDQAKKVFLKAVSYYLLEIYALTDTCWSKLQPYVVPTGTTRGQTTRPVVPKPSQKGAADILGLKRTRMTAQQGISIEMEVDQYLSNPNQGTGILEFWQVMWSIFGLVRCSNVYLRSTNFNTLGYSVLRWISYQSKHPACPVKGFFHLESKRWRLADHASHLTLWKPCKS